MPDMPLATFIDERRDELIARCREKVAMRFTRTPPDDASDGGVPLFLDQLCKELRHQPSETRTINQGALDHGRNLLRQGFSIRQVVHDYGDVCQAITDLAVETKAAISVQDFRTLNRCLDDAIAGAVTQFARGQAVEQNGKGSELWMLVNGVSTAFDMVRSGKVGVSGATGAVIRRNLAALRAFVERRTGVRRSRVEGLPLFAVTHASDRAMSAARTKRPRAVPPNRDDGAKVTILRHKPRPPRAR